MPTSNSRTQRTALLIAVLLATLLVMAVAPPVQAASERSSSAWGGYWYTVRYGDTWYRLSAKTGVPVKTLQAANPSHMHPKNWLYAGHKLWIPVQSPPPPACDAWYRVRSGDSWSRISAATGVPIHALQAANPGKVRPPQYWLYAGESLWIPCGPHQPPPHPTPPMCQYHYTVQVGDSWSKVSAWTGVPISMLQAANPSKVRPPRYWLYAGEKLCIPDP